MLEVPGSNVPKTEKVSKTIIAEEVPRHWFHSIMKTELTCTLGETTHYADIFLLAVSLEPAGTTKADNKKTWSYCTPKKPPLWKRSNPSFDLCQEKVVVPGNHGFVSVHLWRSTDPNRPRRLRRTVVTHSVVVPAIPGEHEYFRLERNASKAYGACMHPIPSNLPFQAVL
uniref:Uncharacterized protein n=1 Tax=Steinernema glaseri TaxID=37863 RepID=A0A1I7YDJ9_9BILA